MSHPNFIIEFNFHNQISAASPLLSLLLLFDASDDVVHVPARSLLLEAGDHGVDVLVVAPSPPEIMRKLIHENLQLQHLYFGVSLVHGLIGHLFMGA